MTWTSVVSYHTDPEVCGVARLSAQLAQRLGVPMVPASDLGRWGAAPLLSIKWSEWGERGWHRWGDDRKDYRNRRLVLSIYDQLWHDDPGEDIACEMSYRPVNVWKLYDLGVPALVQPVRMGQHPALFTFGMSSKIDLARFAVLRARFPTHELWISTATHEGAGPSKVPELLTTWGAGAFDLGHLSDAALSLVWPQVTAFVGFFADGLRANNSSVHAALNAGIPVVTNHDAQTPDDLRSRTYDYRAVDQHTPMPWRGYSPYTWDRLLKELGCEPL
jgi:hypothetical protein